METVVKSTKKCENCVKYLEKMNNSLRRESKKI